MVTPTSVLCPVSWSTTSRADSTTPSSGLCWNGGAFGRRKDTGADVMPIWSVWVMLGRRPYGRKSVLAHWIVAATSPPVTRPAVRLQLTRTDIDRSEGEAWVGSGIAAARGFAPSPMRIDATIIEPITAPVPREPATQRASSTSNTAGITNMATRIPVKEMVVGGMNS